jgi:hypothetical protein
MRSCLLRLALLTGVAATVAPAALAENTSGALRVSVTVARTCRVSTDPPSVRIDCGSRVQPVQITGRSASTPSKAGSPGPSVTIEF